MHELLPMWFLVLSLFLPRISLFILWINDHSFPIPQPGAGIVWFLLPRVLILLMIHAEQGLSAWFWIHLGIAVAAWIASFVQTAVSASK